MKKSTVAQQFASSLKLLGVRFVFGVPSGNMIDYIEALRQQPGIEFIAVGHESTASIMADICGRMTGIPGVCFGTFGPGATNLATGVGGALLDRSPIIAFTDEMPPHLLGRKIQMGIDHQALFKPITKWTTRLQPEKAMETIFMGAEIANSGVPGPVHIGVPAGIGISPVPEPGQPIQTGKVKNELGFKNLDKEIKKFEQAFNQAEKPLLAVGLSAVKAGVARWVKKIAEKFKLPVVLTPMAKGMFPENHPLYVGVLFHALSNHVAETYRQADLIIGIGYDPVEFNYEDWVPNVPLTSIDITPADLDTSNYIIAADVVGDICSTLENFMEFKSNEKGWDLRGILERKQQMFKALKPPENSWGPRAVIEGLRHALPGEGILTVDVGAHLHLAGQQWVTPSPDKLVMTNGWSSMGFAIPSAMAVKLANPNLQVASLMGDGGFIMCMGELATVKRLNLAIVFVVVVDNKLSLIEIKQQKKGFNSTYGTSLNHENDFTADSYFGVPVLKAKDSISYQKALEEAFKLNQPVVIEALVDGEEYKNLVLQPNK